MTDREKALKLVQTYDFMLVELNLYLDNHPEDEKAFECFEHYRKLAAEARECYVKKFGPLSAVQGELVNGKWNWVNDPWPWEVK